jgi:hypothetical protein
MTSVFPAGGADFSGWVMVMLVGGDFHCWSWEVAFATPLDAATVDAPVEVPPELEEVVEVFELDEPQAASARARTRVPMTAANPRARGWPLFRRSGLVGCVMCLSLCVSE